MLGEPALVAGHHAGDAQRVALLAEQGVAAVAGAEGPDRRAPRGTARCTWCRCTARRRRPGPARAAARRSAGPGTNGGVELLHPAQHVVPIRAITRMDAVTYAESVISTPNIGFSASRWPITNGMTYMVRPCMQPAYSPRMRSFISPRVHPVVGGPAVLLVDRADVGAVLDARHVGRVGGGVEGVGLDRRVQPGEGAGRDQRVGQLGPLLVGAGAPVDPVGLGELGDLVDEARMPWWVVGPAVVAERLLGDACRRSCAVPSRDIAFTVARRRCRRLISLRPLRGSRRTSDPARLPAPELSTYWIDQASVARVTSLR